jgi:hypothetical protein
LKDPDFWNDILMNRMMVDIFGSKFIVFITAICAIVNKKCRVPVIAGMSVFIVSILIFPNLHAKHRYYQYAVAMFAIYAVAAAIWAVGELPNTVPAKFRKLAMSAGVMILLTTVGLQTTEFLGGYGLLIVFEPAAPKTLSVSKAARDATDPADAVVVFGFDWSSEVAYYSERRTVAYPPWAGSMIPTNSIEIGQMLGSSRLGAIVDCPDPKYDEWRPRIDQLEAGYAAEQVGDCKVYTPRR